MHEEKHNAAPDTQRVATLDDVFALLRAVAARGDGAIGLKELKQHRAIVQAGIDGDLETKIEWMKSELDSLLWAMEAPRPLDDGTVEHLKRIVGLTDASIADLARRIGADPEHLTNRDRMPLIEEFVKQGVKAS